MKHLLLLTAATAIALTGVPAAAQVETETEQQRTTTRDRLGTIFGTLFGDRSGGSDNLDAQWAAGRTPLGMQRAQFDARVDAEVRTGAIAQATATRLKTEYAELVTLEARFGSDRRFTTAERTELADRYGDLTQVLAQGGYGADDAAEMVDVAQGQAEFDRRVVAAVAARRITRTAGTQLRADYAVLVRLERDYLRDGRISSAERDDLEARLDALDARVGDVVYSAPVIVTPRARLDAIARALPGSGLTVAQQAQLRVEHEDLSWLENAFTRLATTAEDRSYLDRRLGELEMRARVRR